MYFAQWIVVDQGISDIYFNLTFTLSALALFFTVPITGTIIDTHLRRITGLRFTTVLTAFFYGLCAFFALSNQSVYALIFFTLGLYFYLLSFTFYTPLITDICKPEKRGLISGLGISANYLGQITGLLLALPFSTGLWYFFGSSPRAETLLPSVLAFFIFSLPMLIFFNEPRKESGKLNIKDGIKKTFTETKLLFAVSNVFFFLIAYFLFNDAILTVANNYPIFMERVWEVPDTIKTYILLSILVTSALGGIISGHIADNVGHKKSLMVILLGWIFLLPFLGLINNFTLFIIATTLMGFWFGASWTVSRSLMSEIAPAGKHNLAFAYFGLAERASSFIGPIVWGLVVSQLFFLGSYRYRIAVLVMTIFIAFGIIALSKVKTKKTNSSLFPANRE
ncbi:MFS transporter [Candidatus Pacearchaeota archaeon]|nr:MFS transporter [Candidatus Pacearchaeota archaeon]